MSNAIWARSTLVAAGVFGVISASPSGATESHHVSRIEHVLLISIDGFHVVDLANCTASGLCPNIAGLSEHGSTYVNASTTKPSDSFPSLLAQLTGGTPRSTGVFSTTAMIAASFLRAATARGRREPR